MNEPPCFRRNRLHPIEPGRYKTAGSTVAVDAEHPSGLHGGELQGEEVNELVELSVR